MTSNPLRFDGRVAIVTGAGRGLGRSHALFLASRGAAVVVNDAGVSVSGHPEQQPAGASSPADQVAQEIVSQGGRAVASYDAAEHAEKIIELALKTFGRLDIIIHNAGILRDGPVDKGTLEDFDKVFDVNVHAAYKLAHGAWELFRKQKYGRIVLTTSAAGIYGSSGRASFGAAKGGILGLSHTLAREGAKYNIHCNAVAPFAYTRTSEHIGLPREAAAVLTPEAVSALFVYLAHEGTKVTGGLFEAGGNNIAQIRWQRSSGVVFKADESFTPSAVAARWRDVKDFANPTYPQNMTDSDWIGFLDTATKSAPPNPNKGPMRFDGRVVIVTGAGGGLGRAYAHMFARLGAAVVVNDLGVSFKGEGTSSRAADTVVDEIRAAGGTAAANYNSVEDGEAIVRTALDAFKRIDVVVNNAGILRDKSFVRMTDQDWDLVYRVHVRGSFSVTRAAWPHMQRQKYGRIINTASAVGLYGNFGQANYSMAKSALIGFSNSLAIEGAPYNIKVNTVAPNAGTRMTATILPAELLEAFKPDYVAPLVGFLGHEACPDSGSIFEVGSCWVGEIRRQRSAGVMLKNKVPEELGSRVKEVIDFGRATSDVRDTKVALQNLLALHKTSASSAAPGKVDVEGARRATFPVGKYSYTPRDVALYALGLGATRKDLDLVYENADKFGVLPTYGVIPGFFINVPFTQFLPDFNPMMLLHGEQYVETYRPFPTSANLSIEPKIVDIQDKGKGAVVVSGYTARDERGNPICYSESSAFIRGIGGFGGQSVASPANRAAAAVAPNNPPRRAPDLVVQEKTSEDQAALYRLSGDYNPLHIDPAMAAMGGFKVPILHGLCTFGIAGKHVWQAVAGRYFGAIKSIKVRFATPVYPGETLETQLWVDSEDPKKIVFRVRVVERDVFAITNAAAELRSPAKIQAGSRL